MEKVVKCNFFVLNIIKFNLLLRAQEKLKKQKPLHFRGIMSAWIFSFCRKCEMDEASEDSRPAQPGFVKKFFVTISQVIHVFQNCQFLIVIADLY